MKKILTLALLLSSSVSSAIPIVHGPPREKREPVVDFMFPWRELPEVVPTDLATGDFATLATFLCSKAACPVHDNGLVVLEVSGHRVTITEKEHWEFQRAISDRRNKSFDINSAADRLNDLRFKRDLMGLGYVACYGAAGGCSIAAALSSVLLPAKVGLLACAGVAALCVDEFKKEIDKTDKEIEEAQNPKLKKDDKTAYDCNCGDTGGVLGRETTPSGTGGATGWRPKLNPVVITTEY